MDWPPSTDVLSEVSIPLWLHTRVVFVREIFSGHSSPLRHLSTLKLNWHQLQFSDYPTSTPVSLTSFVRLLTLRRRCKSAQPGRSSSLLLNEKLNDARQRYSNYDLEFYVIIQSLQYWRHYLLPREFVLYPDHQALCYYILCTISVPTRVHLWLLKHRWLIISWHPLMLSPDIQIKSSSLGDACWWGNRLIWER